MNIHLSAAARECLLLPGDKQELLKPGFSLVLSCRQAQCIGVSIATFVAGRCQKRIVPCLIGDGVRIQGILITHSTLEADRKIHSCTDMLPLDAQAGDHLGDNPRYVAVDCTAFKEMVYLMWLARRLHLDIRGTGVQKDVAFRAGVMVQVSLITDDVSRNASNCIAYLLRYPRVIRVDIHSEHFRVKNLLSTGEAAVKGMLLLQVATESGTVGVEVVEKLAIARARGGVYKVVCQTGPCAGQLSVLKHGRRPEELAQLTLRRVSTADWHQVSFWIHPRGLWV